ncbi:hypothetical protein GCM10009706_19000 [Curtobacterium citreum]|uniref:Uncharacterized protein n=1 Tax=Curtobacterium citreum TaxID=2036 RepID=A0ABT2HG63_9MICO|nr:MULTISPECIES: hypothetical protein [Curtobacterium]MCS6522257.1 hypothetical protein [Curtobacterium citreum]GGL80630.1 hypothetical protein GCM10009706_19000 [Curtobacterium citreum]
MNRVTGGRNANREADLAFDRELLLAYLSALVLALLVEAFWISVIASRSDLLAGAAVAVMAVLAGGLSRRRTGAIGTLDTGAAHGGDGPAGGVHRTW